MTDNDYIAEYVKEKRPDVLKGRSFIEWKLARLVSNASKEIAQLFMQFLDEDLSEAAGDEEEKADDND